MYVYMYMYTNTHSHIHTHIYIYIYAYIFVYNMCKIKTHWRIIYNLSIYKRMIIAITVTITTMAITESDDKSEIGSIGTNKFVSIFLISDLSSHSYLHYYHHHHHHHHYQHYYNYYHYNINKIYVSVYIHIFTAIRKRKKKNKR